MFFGRFLFLLRKFKWFGMGIYIDYDLLDLLFDVLWNLCLMLFCIGKGSYFNFI